MKLYNKQTITLFCLALILGNLLGLHFKYSFGLFLFLGLGSALVVVWKQGAPSVRWRFSLIIFLILFGFVRVHVAQYQVARFLDNVVVYPPPVLAGRVVAVRGSMIEIKLLHSPIRLRGYYRGNVPPFSTLRFVVTPKKLFIPSWGDPIKVTFRLVTVSHRSPFVWVYQLRNRWTQMIQEHMLEPLGSWFRLLLLGDEGMPMDPESQSIFKYLGIMHLMVVSGAQMGILSQMILLTTRRFALSMTLEALLLVFVQGLFAMMVGGGVSVWRSMLMSLIAYGSLRSRRALHGITILELTVLLMLMIYPTWVTSVGFWLSVLATAGLIELSPLLEKYLIEVFQVPKTIAGWLAVMMGPLWLTAPVILLVFHRLDILSLFANLLIVPLVEWIVVTGFVGLAVLAVLPVLAPLVLGFEEGLMAWVYQLVQFFKQISGMTVYMPFTPWPLIVGWFGMLYVFLRHPWLLWKNRQLVLVLMGVVILFQGVQIARQPSRWCYIQHRQGGWVMVSHKNNAHLILMNQAGLPLFQNDLLRYPLLNGPVRSIIKERWLLSPVPRGLSVGDEEVGRLEDGRLSLDPLFPGLIVEMVNDRTSSARTPVFRFVKDELWYGRNHWSADRGLVLIWEGRIIRVVSATQYFS